MKLENLVLTAIVLLIHKEGEAIYSARFFSLQLFPRVKNRHFEKLIHFFRPLGKAARTAPMC